ncbi:hypothetical protein E8L09_02185 [Streptococcus suis]|uniref:Phage protein n=1 Tax=Streptococcus suis TaxID=1307 RepID=A0A4V4RXX2_STRSU|nr:hypothetical protein [Streptococcus suis]MBO4113383.1 hypothetical protein [Streptococcus suis]TII05305.1 hypothetical protein E8L09_02185 [Streptococcus suis]
MTKTPFTQELLQQVYEDNGLVSFDLLLERLKGWTIEGIKARFNQWRHRGIISYSLLNDEIEDFQFLKTKREEKQEITEGRKLKLDEYFKQVLATADIINKPTASDTNRLKAIHLQQQALTEIPDDIFKEFSEVYA